MRILHVNKFLYRRGGAEAYMEDVASLQVERGHTVAFFGMAHPENTHLELAAHFPPQVDLEPPPPSVRGKAKAAGRMLWSTSAARGIGQAVDAFGPDVVHLHNIYHQLSPSILRPLAARGIPAVMTLHDYKLTCPTYLFLDKGTLCEACLGGAFYNAPLRRCRDGSLTASAMMALELFVHRTAGSYDPVSRFICPSRFLLEKMRTAGVYPDRLRHLPSFVETSAGDPVRAPRAAVVYAGRLSPEKGVDVLVRAAAALPHGTTVEIAGDGKDRAALEALAQAEAPGKVRFHGRLPKEAIPELMRDATAVVCPSRCYENQPLTVLEAFGLGVPVVGSDLGGITELITDGVDGVLVPADDPAALAAALTRLLDDADTAVLMGKRGLDKVRTGFSADGFSAGLEAIYAEAAGSVRVAAGKE